MTIGFNSPYTLRTPACLKNSLFLAGACMELLHFRYFNPISPNFVYGGSKLLLLSITLQTTKYKSYKISFFQSPNAYISKRTLYTKLNASERSIFVHFGNGEKWKSTVVTQSNFIQTCIPSKLVFFTLAQAKYQGPLYQTSRLPTKSQEGHYFCTEHLAGMPRFTLSLILLQDMEPTLR